MFSFQKLNEIGTFQDFERKTLHVTASKEDFLLSGNLDDPFNFVSTSDSPRTSRLQIISDTDGNSEKRGTINFVIETLTKSTAVSKSYPCSKYHRPFFGWCIGMGVSIWIRCAPVHCSYKRLAEILLWLPPGW
ncbi:MAG: hypothetical protein JKY54_17320 [Flavobacteriales bacterium]|nr:hypothetical protein [Flavobacteriales bacterium]